MQYLGWIRKKSINWPGGQFELLKLKVGPPKLFENFETNIKRMLIIRNNLQVQSIKSKV